ncbi:hypothetical protein M0813_28184 [Anaeramoeba flamelloides]|uniref:Reverse transcriptase zinc-binding domain-containing protein n=1 Tax=Anaeramoeba flamelloides TaxID=1746091 RepID=A0ABQ8XUQ6_9EUKA|nr:hypothetical protein M0813_28184 [Anaeramoeba flamelloides]
MNCIQENSKKFLSEVNLETINIESNINNKIQTISEFENENDCSELVVHNNKEKKVQKNLDFFLNKQKSQLGINTNNKNNELILINKNINKKIININLTKNKNKNKTVKCKGFSKTTNNRCKKFTRFEKLIKLLPFREKESENINWKSKTLKDLELELDNYRINQLKNSPSWKVRKYLKIVTIQGNINKQQKYLKWKGSTSILKLRTFTNYLNRYSYVMNEDKSKFCKLCKKINNLDIIEDLDHFLWNCPAYENNRKIWISELKNINISHILKNNNISNIIDRKDSITLLALVENKSIWKSLKKLLNHNLGIRANKRN